MSSVSGNVRIPKRPGPALTTGTRLSESCPRLRLNPSTRHARGQFRSNEIDVDQLRARLRKMRDETLLRFGRAAAYMCSPQANYHEPRQAFVVQLEETRTE